MLAQDFPFDCLGVLLGFLIIAFLESSDGVKQLSLCVDVLIQDFRIAWNRRYRCICLELDRLNIDGVCHGGGVYLEARQPGVDFTDARLKTGRTLRAQGLDRRGYTLGIQRENGGRIGNRQPGLLLEIGRSRLFRARWQNRQKESG
jgi:hypothetical protein